MEILLDKERCTGCGECVDACPFGALRLEKDFPVASEECRLCGLCVKACKEGALSLPEVKKRHKEIKTKDIFVFAETKDGNLATVVYELLGKGRELADKLGQKLIGVLIGSNIKNLAQTLIDYGADIVYVFDHHSLKRFN
ncbi:MAG TPA: 4Fe-4S dicluster domain-containing protein, partial [Candidatus Desulfofervidus auxilii]|nr:4Fe-4S dicluster domain-containing protein [Candidatus Desulfofervidus auxilii]